MWNKKEMIIYFIIEMEGVFESKININCILKVMYLLCFVFLLVFIL